MIWTIEQVLKNLEIAAEPRGITAADLERLTADELDNVGEWAADAALYNSDRVDWVLDGMPAALKAIEALRACDVLMLCGLPGLGKSTLARQLSSNIVSADGLRARSRRFTYMSAMDLCDAIREEATERAKPLVIDACNLTADYRRRSLPTAARAVALWMLPDLDLSEERRRGAYSAEKLAALARVATAPTEAEWFNRIITVDPRTMRVVV